MDLKKTIITIDIIVNDPQPEAVLGLSYSNVSMLTEHANILFNSIQSYRCGVDTMTVRFS